MRPPKALLPVHSKAKHQRRRGNVLLRLIIIAAICLCTGYAFWAYSFIEKGTKATGPPNTGTPQDDPEVDSNAKLSTGVASKRFSNDHQGLNVAEHLLNDKGGHSHRGHAPRTEDLNTKHLHAQSFGNSDGVVHARDPDSILQQEAHKSSDSDLDAVELRAVSKSTHSTETGEDETPHQTHDTVGHIGQVLHHNEDDTQRHSSRGNEQLAMLEEQQQHQEQQHQHAMLQQQQQQQHAEQVQHHTQQHDIGDWEQQSPVHQLNHVKRPSLWSLSAVDIDGKEHQLSEFAGNVTIVVNVASACGYTDENYRGLQSTYDKYHRFGLEILGFPCNQFGRQEPGSETEIKDFCTSRYHVTFPMFSKVDVNGPNMHPVFEFLKRELPELEGGGGGRGPGKDLVWNFQKFLVNKQGMPEKFFYQTYDIAAVEQEVYRMLHAEYTQQ